MTGNPYLALICHVERLFPDYGGGRIYFSLNLSVTMVGAAAQTDLLFLKPWNWKLAGVRA
jgi:hypothetical protein